MSCGFLELLGLIIFCDYSLELLRCYLPRNNTMTVSGNHLNFLRRCTSYASTQAGGNGMPDSPYKKLTQTFIIHDINRLMGIRGGLYKNLAPGRILHKIRRLPEVCRWRVQKFVQINRYTATKIATNRSGFSPLESSSQKLLEAPILNKTNCLILCRPLRCQQE